ncbi:hypothetical protein-signal peptide prediction [Rhodopirellula baltica SH 1]|uniref:Uncharacterized protein n=1 Tax=Rhodopirellula baltica (strain DSM 10527 / NCIMB 13988 / SH1) TaxID=243090 RepID=Q7UZB1_RHOBA|nr:hypothetical protein-signal peptide prediction [Rhodopirellula baltica SH 1]
MFVGEFSHAPFRWYLRTRLARRSWACLTASAVASQQVSANGGDCLCLFLRRDLAIARGPCVHVDLHHRILFVFPTWYTFQEAGEDKRDEGDGCRPFAIELDQSVSIRSRSGCFRIRGVRVWANSALAAAVRTAESSSIPSMGGQLDRNHSACSVSSVLGLPFREQANTESKRCFRLIEREATRMFGEWAG